MNACLCRSYLSKSSLKCFLMPQLIRIGLCFCIVTSYAYGANKEPIRALYIPLADHYAALVAYERYAPHMQHADFQLSKMNNWDLLRAHFYEGRADLAFVMSPLAMDMYREMGNFRWVGLMHRDGNALAVNDIIARQLELSPHRKDRTPNQDLANAIKNLNSNQLLQLKVGVPHLLSTHSVVLHKYFSSYGLRMDKLPHGGGDVLIITQAPPLAPKYILGQANRATPAAFEQSLPWADIVETSGFGKIAWYSKDVIKWPNGHVECIAIATDRAIASKERALREVMTAIHKAGADIEAAREQGGEALEDIVKIVRKHIPSHSREAIVASLDPELKVINYRHLNIDKAGLAHIMGLAVQANILSEPIDIDAFGDPNFHVDLTQQGCCIDE
ncbi:ABC transporter substrate-binding protein [Saccharophagus degradans]|nr:ABC transporter substrate-binding protein [Saccharophagus degradans]